MPEKRFRASNDALSREQVKNLINNTTHTRDQLMITMGIFSGCRVNELAHLKLDKIDWVQDTITVWDDKKNQWSWKRNEQGKKVRDVKLTEGKWRKIAIPHEVMLQLKEYVGKYPTGTDQVWNVSWVTWNRTMKKWAGVILSLNKSWHCLRHTYVSLHQTAGTPIAFLKQQTGDTAATLMRVYDNPTPDMIKENAEKRLF